MKRRMARAEELARVAASGRVQVSLEAHAVWPMFHVKHPFGARRKRVDESELGAEASRDRRVLCGSMDVSRETSESVAGELVGVARSGWVETSVETTSEGEVSRETGFWRGAKKRGRVGAMCFGVRVVIDVSRETSAALSERRSQTPGLGRASRTPPPPVLAALVRSGRGGSSPESSTDFCGGQGERKDFTLDRASGTR